MPTGQDQSVSLTRHADDAFCSAIVILIFVVVIIIVIVTPFISLSFSGIFQSGFVLYSVNLLQQIAQSVNKQFLFERFQPERSI
jgi:hypothetical protein